MVWESKCVVHGSNKTPVYIANYTIDKLEPNQVLIKTEYASINPIDVKLHSMSFRNKQWHTLKDFAGVVEAVGSEAARSFAVGQPVWGSIHRPSDHSFVGSYTVADIKHDALSTIPHSLTPEKAAALPVAYGTAFQLLERADVNKKLDANSRVLILGGATSVGTFAIELAKKRFGVGHVAVTCSQSSVEYVKSYGADSFIDYRSTNFRKELVAAASKGKFDTIIDCVGGYDALAVFPQILKHASEGSTYITVMGDAGPADTYAKTMINALCTLPRSIFRYVFGKYYGINYSFLLLTNGTWIDAAGPFFATPGVRVPIDSVYPLDDIKKAWDKVDSTRAKGKVLVKFN